MSELSIFNFNYTSKPFSTLEANFWDSLQQIGKNHQLICSHFLKEQSGEEKKENNTKILDITENLKTLVQSDLRFFYFQFLKFNFILSQPLTLGQLKKNFQNKIFPYYLFTLLTKKKEFHYMIIDLIEKKISIFNKNQKLETIPKEKILTLMKENNNAIIITLNDNQITNEKKKNIEIIPEFNIQSELIYLIISFMMQMGETKKDPEIQNFSLLEDDTYIPKGFLLKNYIFKSHQKKILSKDRRFAVLGPSQIIIFKDKSMKEIRNITPLIHFGTQLKSDDKDHIITLKYFNRKHKMEFLDYNIYSEWKRTLKDIFNKKKEEKIDGITLYKIREKEVNSKILEEINIDIINLEEKIKNENNEFEKAKEAITNGIV